MDLAFSTWWAFCQREDLRALSPIAAREIALTNYWNATHCDKVYGALGIVLCDAAWVSGPKTAIRWLQKGLKLSPEDGIFGPMTQRAVDVMTPPASLSYCIMYTNIRNAATAQMSNAAEFNKGWTRRANDCLQVALNYKGN